ncbi:unnamed protein product [Litomosoides sigmodontis]|uniref:Saposin B-type domain-containing protein n=1 Tax=Litomosoides sigmodontis TaxID=42156 RepID=A0A3P7JLS5_LITSI|nr:unnamed protein product [Litomosoides sigmodontis]
MEEMKFISIVLAVIVVVVLVQTNAVKLSELTVLKTQHEGSCDLCKAFINGVLSAAAKLFAWINKEVKELCEECFAGNTTAASVCMMKVETALKKVQEYVTVKEDAETICKKLYLC